MEITTFLEKTVESEMSGNVIDLCPVGALTSKPYSYEARPWELNKIETIDVMDAVGSNIRVDTKGWEVKRVLPRINDEINEEWISDKTRFVWDGLRRQRLDRPYIRENGKLRPANWDEALGAAAAAMKSRTVAGLIGDLVPVEAAFALKQLITGLGGEVDNPDWKAQWPGKAAIEDGQVVVEVKKQGKVTDSRFQIDGMAGATITTQGVHRLVRFWLGEQGFGKYLTRPNKIQTTTQKQ